MPLEQNIVQYYRLKSADKLTKMRLQRLNAEIKTEMFALCADEAEDPDTFSTTVGDYVVTVHRGASNLKIDDCVLEQFLVDKNLWKDASKQVVDRDAVEQLRLNDKISDAELEALGANTDPTLSLHVEKLNV